MTENITWIKDIVEFIPYNVISIIISIISVFISFIALYYSIKYSYNPKLTVEPLNNDNVYEIVNVYNKNKYRFRRMFYKKYKYAYGVSCNDGFSYSFTLLWTRIKNESKYPITIYDIKYSKK